MITHFWLCFRIRFFEFRGYSYELNFETNVEFEILHMYRHDHCDRYFLCDQEISSLVVSFSEHCARRKKTEKARQTVAKKAATNGFSFFGFFLGVQKMGSHYVSFTVLVSVVIVVLYFIWPFACWPIILIQLLWEICDFVN